jgi:hypothetical protein
MAYEVEKVDDLRLAFVIHWPFVHPKEYTFGWLWSMDVTCAKGILCYPWNIDHVILSWKLMVTRACKARHGTDAVQQWEVWCCDLPSLTCSSVKVCLCTWHDDSEHPAANVQQTYSCSWNPQQKTKTTKTLKELVGPVEFCRLLRLWEERERESVQAKEGEEM